MSDPERMTAAHFEAVERAEDGIINALSLEIERDPSSYAVGVLRDRAARLSEVAAHLRQIVGDE